MGYQFQGHQNGSQGHQPVSQGYYAPTQQPSTSAYGSVYYSVGNGADVGNHLAFRGEALDLFFGNVKRGNIDVTSYSDISKGLQPVHGLEPSLLSGGGMAFLQPASLPIDAHTEGGYGSIASHSYALPPMQNLRTRKEMEAVGDLLSQMTNTAYDNSNSNSMATVGMAQPGVHHVHSSMAIRSSNSPSGALPLPNTHVSATGSNHGSTPELTPGSSAMSYSSGHSPSSVGSNSGMSPSPSMSLYPSLPSAPPTSNSNSHPSSTLASQYDADSRRRFSGGTLQRAQPASMHAAKRDHSLSPPPPDHLVDSVDTDALSPAPTQSNLATSKKIDRHNIDPALAGITNSNSESAGSPTPPATSEADERWVENMRLLEWLKAFVRGKLERGEWEEEGEERDGEVKAKGMGKEAERIGMGDGEVLYPVLRAVGVRSG